MQSTVSSLGFTRGRAAGTTAAPARKNPGSSRAVEEGKTQKARKEIIDYDHIFTTIIE